MRRYINMTINLKELVGSRIKKTTGTRKLTIKGNTDNFPVYIIPLDLLYYNDRNGRIATYISQYISSGNALNKSNLEEYNNILQEFIKRSNPTALENTKINIEKFNQRVPGVVLNDGRVIDGNRRFTCLRMLKQEGKDVFFEAVILDPADGIDERDIKRLELNLQHAEERPVDYNPIDNLVDVYRDVVENKLFTIKEYAENTNKKPKDVELMLKKAELMVQLLEFMNANGQYHIAREMELDGPLQELVTILNKDFKNSDFRKLNEANYEDKAEQAEYLRIRNALFTAIFSKRKVNDGDDKGDLTREIRDMGKYIINADNREEFLDEYEEIVEEVYETFHEHDVVNSQTIKDIGRELSDVRKEGREIIEKKVEDTRVKVTKAKPVDLLNKAFDDIDRIELDQVERLDVTTASEFKVILEKIEEKMKVFGERINV